jgi:hypothetical protein
LDDGRQQADRTATNPHLPGTTRVEHPTGSVGRMTSIQTGHPVRPSQPWSLGPAIVLAATTTALLCTSLFVRHTPRAWQRQPVLDRIEVVALLLVRNAMASSGSLDEQADLNQTDHLQTPAGSASAGRSSGYFTLETGGKVVWTTDELAGSLRCMAAQVRQQQTARSSTPRLLPALVLLNWLTCQWGTR